MTNENKFCSNCHYWAPASNVHNDPEGDCFHSLVRVTRAIGRNAIFARKEGGKCGVSGNLFLQRVGPVRRYWEHGSD